MLLLLSALKMTLWEGIYNIVIFCITSIDLHFWGIKLRYIKGVTRVYFFTETLAEFQHVNCMIVRIWEVKRVACYASRGEGRGGSCPPPPNLNIGGGGGALPPLPNFRL